LNFTVKSLGSKSKLSVKPTRYELPSDATATASVASLAAPPHVVSVTSAGADAFANDGSSTSEVAVEISRSQPAAASRRAIARRLWLCRIHNS
jgi:hypothetical protein